MDPSASEELEQLRAQVRNLKKQVAMWESVSDLSRQELIAAQETIHAQEQVLDLSNTELRVLRKDIERFIGVETQMETRILNVLSFDPSGPEEKLQQLEALRAEGEETFCTDFFRVTMNLRFAPAIAEDHWHRAIAHRSKMQQSMGRPVALVVALLDYFSENGSLVRSPKVMEIAVFAEMVKSAVVDPLTGLYNRRFLDKIMGREIMRAKRSGHAMTIIVSDIDHFKSINDEFGHPAGDQVLIGVAQILLGASRQEDSACRLGGEEFLVLLPELGTQKAFGVAELIRSRVEAERFAIPRRVTISLGVASFPECREAFKDIFLAADQALYRAKVSGRNQTVIARAATAG